jgi:nitroimidazol reductase NimA-like FMN-containing flavoprotein (pyridoxamine 5'-phosphate oxidase superfamily)
MMGNLTIDEIEKLLHQSIVGRIACTNGKIPYVVPISYAYDGQYVYCHTDKGLKIDIMRKNALVCFEVEQFQDMANWRTVIAHGEFQELTDPALRLAALQKLHERRLPVISSQTTLLTNEWPFDSNALGEIKGIVFSIRLTAKSGRFEKVQQPVQPFF